MTSNTANKKVALVTGASSDMGKAFAKAFLAAGWPMRSPLPRKPLGKQGDASDPQVVWVIACSTRWFL